MKEVEMGDRANTCPVCGKAYPPGVIICTACGVDLRTGESLPTSFYEPEPFNWAKVASVVKLVIYVGLLGVVAHFGWKYYKKSKEPAEEGRPAEAPAQQPAQATGPRNQPARPVRKPVVREETDQDKLAEAATYAANPGEAGDAVAKFSVLLRKDITLADGVIGDSDPMVRISVAKALGTIGSEQAGELLFRLMGDDDRRVAEAAGLEAQRLRRDLLTGMAVKALESPKQELRRAAVEILTRLRSQEEAPNVMKMFEDADAGVVRRAVDFFRNVAIDDEGYRKLLKLAARAEDPPLAGMLYETINFRSTQQNVKVLAEELDKFPREKFFILTNAAGKVRNSEAATTLQKRVDVLLGGVQEDFRERVVNNLFNASPGGRRMMYAELFTHHARPEGFGDLAVIWLKSPSPEANRVSASALWAWKSRHAPLALASGLGEPDAFTAIVTAIALSRQDKGEVGAVAEKVMKSGSAQEKALASAAAYLAGDKTAIEGCRKALAAGSVNEITAAFLRAVAVEAGDEAALKAAKAAIRGARAGSMEALLGEAALLMGGQDGSEDQMVEAAGATKTSGAAILAGYFLWRAADRGNPEALAPMLKLYGNESFHTDGIIFGSMVAAENPEKLAEAVLPGLEKLPPRMAMPLAIALKPRADEVGKILAGVLKDGTAAQRKAAMYLFGELGVDNEEVRATVAGLMKDNKDDAEFLRDARVLVTKLAGDKKVENEWQEMFKILAPDQYDLADEPLRRQTVKGELTVLVPKNWKEAGERYTTDRLPGNPLVRVSLQQDTNVALEKRRFRDTKSMAEQIQQRYMVDMLTHKRIKGVEAGRSEFKNQGGLTIAMTPISEEEGGTTRLMGCAVHTTRGLSRYVEVECRCETKYFERYRPFFEKVVLSIDLLSVRP
ncbi:MAG: hypothetical protein JW909_07395 [Planctomycetes bacterium]|nr:hypothetical protein [Planctomycetota bacterium]